MAHPLEVESDVAIRDAKIERLRVEAYRGMSGEQKIDIAAEMFEDGVAIVQASILARQPDITREELSRQVRRRVLPPELAEQVEVYLRKRSMHELAARHPASSH
jgi:hypothetical protein